MVGLFSLAFGIQIKFTALFYTDKKPKMHFKLQSAFFLFLSIHRHTE